MIRPELARLIAALPYDLDAARDAAAAARAALAAAVGSFEARAIAIPQREEGGPLVDEVRTLFSHVTSQVDTTAQAVSAGFVDPSTVDTLRDGAERLEGAEQRLEAFEQARPRLASVPTIDRFIVTGMNVRHQRVDAESLRGQVPGLISLAATMTADLERFRLLYPEAPDAAEAYQAELRKIQAGINAARAWASSGAEQPLLDALRLLHSGGEGILAPLQAMDAHVRGQARHSRVVAVEEVARCAEALQRGQISTAVFAQAVAHLEGLIDFHQGAAAEARAFPLLFALRSYVADLDEQADAARGVSTPWLERARTSPLEAATDASGLAAVRVAVEAAADAQQRVRGQIDDLLAVFSGAPQWLDVLTATAMALRDEIPVDLARHRVTDFLTRTESLQQELAAQAASEEAFETRTLLADQADALRRTLEALDHRDEGALRDAVLRLREALPRLDAIQRDLRAGADAQRRAREQGVTCFRCGAANAAGQRYCGACNAVLPVRAIEETVYTDIVGAEESMALPENLQTLQNLYVLAESGGESEAVTEGLATLHAQLQGVARQYEEGFAGRTDALPPNAAEYATAFSAQLQQLIEAIETMYQGAQAGSLDHMGRGLQAALGAGQEMQELQAHMQQNAVQ